MGKLYFLVGLPGSSKSTWAETHKDELNAVIHSSDSIREQLGDINDQSQNNKVFDILHQRVKEDLLNGKNVIYDSTGLKRKNRVHLISNVLRCVPCEKVCVLFATPIEICKKNNNKRERQVPEYVIDRMYKNFEVPAYAEQWDDIQIVWWEYEKDGLIFNYAKDLCEWSKINHDSKYHNLSIGNHMLTAEDYYADMDIDRNKLPILYDVIIMHDCGKAFCKEFVDSKGNRSETAHYYQHQNVGSFLSLFYLKELDMYNDKEILYGSLLINLHMRPYEWNKSEKAREKDRRLFGEDIYNNLLIINECDKAAH